MSKLWKRGLVLGLLLLFVSGLTIYFTVDLKSLASLESFNGTSIILALLALAVGMYFDGLRLQNLVAMAGYTLSIKAIFRVIFGNYFMALLTPGASGGAVAQVLILKSYGLPILKGTPIVLIRTVFSILFLICMLPIIFATTHMEIPYIQPKVLMILSLLAVLLVALGIYALQTHWCRQLIFSLGQRINSLQSKQLLRQLDNLNEGLGLLYKHPKKSLVVFVESGLSLLALYCIAPALMLAFTSSIDVWAVLQYMIVLNLILYFAPTPGGTGVAEGLFVFFFTPFVAPGTVGLTAVAWRMITEYLPFLIGMYAVLTLYGSQFLNKNQEP